MSAELFLQEFERIADAPDLLAQLRRFVLDLSVRGRLVEQIPSEGSGTDVLALARSACERSRGRLSGPADIRSSRQLVEPYDLPSTWIWARFGDIARFSAGRTPSRNDLDFWDSGGYPWVSIADMPDGDQVMATKETVSPKAKELVFKVDPEPVGTMIMSFKLTIGKIARLGVAAYHNEAIVSITPWVRTLDPFLFLVLPERARRGATKGAVKGATLNRESLGDLLVPLPPLAEQHRIVAKVDELMSLCDRLEAVQKEREVVRARLRAASLHRLTPSDGGAKPAATDVRFFLDSSPRLITKPEHIASVRQTILDLAVRGQLVRQDPADEPVEHLIERIHSLGPSVLRHGRRTVPIVPAFEVPSTWQWVQLGTIAEIVMGQSPPGSSYNKTGEGVPLINGPVEFTAGPFGLTKVNQYTTSPTSLCRKGDLLLCVRGSTTGRTNIAAFDACIGRGVAAVRPILCEPYVRLFIWLQRDSLIAMGRGIAFPSISRDQIAHIAVPLPPPAEQTRIVAKVDELTVLCDQLEAALASAQDWRARLLEAVLHEALEGGAVPNPVGMGTAV